MVEFAPTDDFRLKSSFLGAEMATLQQEIAESFLIKLEESEHVDSQQIEHLRALLADGKKLKADDVLKILSPAGGGDLK